MGAFVIKWSSSSTFTLHFSCLGFEFHDLIWHAWKEPCLESQSLFLSRVMGCFFSFFLFWEEQERGHIQSHAAAAAAVVASLDVAGWWQVRRICERWGRTEPSSYLQRARHRLSRETSARVLTLEDQRQSTRPGCEGREGVLPGEMPDGV